jgi:alanine-synthesizing transaminase
MEFRRINGLPPYVFATINDLKALSRRAGRDVIDLGFGNPDLPSPDVAVNKLAEAVHNPRNHRYSASRGIPKLRSAITDLYLRKFNVELDPESEVVTTIGAKEGFSHLMWVLVGPGDTALVPSPSYPIHIWGPLFSGADVRQVPLRRGVLRWAHQRVRGVVAQAAGHRAVVPAQSHDGVCGSLIHGTVGRFRPRA